MKAPRLQINNPSPKDVYYDKLKRIEEAESQFRKSEYNTSYELTSEERKEKQESVERTADFTGQKLGTTITTNSVTFYVNSEKTPVPFSGDETKFTDSEGNNWVIKRDIPEEPIVKYKKLGWGKTILISISILIGALILSPVLVYFITGLKEVLEKLIDLLSRVNIQIS